MLNHYVPKEPTSSSIKDGFSTDPIEATVAKNQVLIVYRAHGKTSAMIGRFYFTPQIAGTPRSNWPADLLEKELNAAFWGNDFRHLAKFKVRAGTRFKIGPIAHDKYQGVERCNSGEEKDDIPFDQYSYFKNRNMFFQVEIQLAGDWRQHLELLENSPIEAGRFVRRTGNC